MKVTCEICPHHCTLENNQTGLCQARTNIKGVITCTNYGLLTSIALDPIEKKPLARYMPDSKILSVGSYGCNMRCPFCQNHSISMATQENAETVFTTPQALVQKALSLLSSGNIGIAYTYNEPLISVEYVSDCAVLAHQNGLKNVLVTNGYICEEPLIKLLPLIDAMNIDLKGFTEAFYKKLCGDLETVKKSIALTAKSCHVEITTLIVPGENDSEGEIEALSTWIAGISPDIPLHLSRFFPRYQYFNKGATPVSQVYDLAEVARRHLEYVYTGNC